MRNLKCDPEQRLSGSQALSQELREILGTEERVYVFTIFQNTGVII